MDIAGWGQTGGTQNHQPRHCTLAAARSGLGHLLPVAWSDLTDSAAPLAAIFQPEFLIKMASRYTETTKLGGYLR
jgi:hypothetical protein